MFSPSINSLPTRSDITFPYRNVSSDFLSLVGAQHCCAPPTQASTTAVAFIARPQTGTTRPAHPPTDIPTAPASDQHPHAKSLMLSSRPLLPRLPTHTHMHVPQAPLLPPGKSPSLCHCLAGLPHPSA